MSALNQTPKARVFGDTELSVFSNKKDAVVAVSQCEGARYCFKKGRNNILLCVDTGAWESQVVVPVYGKYEGVNFAANVGKASSQGTDDKERTADEKTPAVSFFCAVPETEGEGDVQRTDEYFQAKLKDCRVLVLFCSKGPIDMRVVAAWKHWLLTLAQVHELKMDFLREGEFDVGYVRGRIARHCSQWCVPDPQSRRVTLRRGGLVSHADAFDELTPVMFGEMQEVISMANCVKQRFYEDFKKVFLDVKKEEISKTGYLTKVQEKLKADSQSDIDLTFLPKPAYLPKLLLRGETGVGKTFLAKMMIESDEKLTKELIESDEKLTKKLTRISIPEFLGKEDYFEYMMFGYAKGAYTDASENGSCGMLLENVGSVVFLDEIGEANASLQAKLLAYLDDYMVRPRGWVKDAFFAPTFIVAGTNRNLEQMVAEGTFRQDLLARFTDVLTIPPLRRRMESIDFILDCLLQREDINPGGVIEGITDPAHRKLRHYSYEKGNFRELEEIVRTACWRAKNSGRTSEQEDFKKEDGKKENQFIYAEDLTI